MLREPISQLARVGRQIHIDLLHLFNHLLSGPIIRTELPSRQVGPLVIAAHDTPENEVRHVLRNGPREGREDVGPVANLRCVAANAEG